MVSNDVLYLKGHCIYHFATTPTELQKAKERTRHIIQLAKANGTRDIYLYGRDELTGKKLASQRKCWKAIREAGGKIFVAGGRDNLPLMGDIQDMQVKAGWPDKEEVAGWHKYKHKIFSYFNPQVGVENPELYRRGYGLIMWKYNYDGIANNAYQHSFGFTWNDFDHNKFRAHTFAYPTKNGVVDTIAWEGYREAIDDVRYICTLEAMLQKAQKLNKPELKQQIAAAKSFIKNLRNSYEIESCDLDKLRTKIIKKSLNLKFSIKKSFKPMPGNIIIF